jgi:hypothetical protein
LQRLKRDRLDRLAVGAVPPNAAAIPCMAFAMSLAPCAAAAVPCVSAAFAMSSAAFFRFSAACSACFCASDLPHAVVNNAATNITVNICRIVILFSPSDSESILTQVRSTQQHTGAVIDPESLISAHGAAALDDDVAFCLERAPHIRADAAFDGQLLPDVPNLAAS